MHLLTDEPDKGLLRLLESGISGVFGRDISRFNFVVLSKSAKATTALQVALFDLLFSAPPCLCSGLMKPDNNYQITV